MVSFPQAKINLGLQIISKRQDGYHEIATCFYPVPWTDVLEVVPHDKDELVVTGTAIPGEPSDNLCWKALQLLRAEFKIPSVYIHLHKIIPTGSGLGGGSSDAANTLKLLNGIFSLELDQSTLAGYAAKLGSDCPFFVYDEPMTGTGRGEVLNAARVDLSGFFLVIIKPEIHISTMQAYAGVVPSIPTVRLDRLLKEHPGVWKGRLKNDFEPSVFQGHPALNDIKERLYATGALYASLSGSGSALFGIFEKELDVSAHFKGAVCWQARL